MALSFAVSCQALVAHWVAGSWLAGGAALSAAFAVLAARLLAGPGRVVWGTGLLGALCTWSLAFRTVGDAGDGMVNPIPLSLALAFGAHLLGWTRLWMAREAADLVGAARFTLLGGLLGGHGSFGALMYAHPASWAQGLGLLSLGASLLAWWHVEGEGGFSVPRRVTARWTLGRTGRTGLLRPAAVGCAAVLAVLFWAFPPAERIAGRARDWLAGEKASSLEDYGGSKRRQATSSGPDAGTGERQLPQKLSLELGDGIRVGVRFADEAGYLAAIERPLYLRAWSYAEVVGDSVLGPARLGEWRFDEEDGETDGWVTLNGRPGPVRLDLYVPREEFGALPMPNLTRRLGAEAVYEYAPDWYQLLPDESVRKVRLPVTAQFPPPAVERLPGADWDLAAEPGQRIWLPDSAFMRRVEELGREALPAGGGMGARLAHLRRWLQERCRYSLRYDNARGLPPLENFLDAERAGHCELFSAAALVLLQSQGIPARLSYGYCGGEGDPQARTVLFRERDFHAWVEVPVEGVGWAIFDPTPTGQGALRPVMPASADSEPTGAAKTGWRWEDFEPLQMKGLSLPAMAPSSEDWRQRLHRWLTGFGGTAPLFAGALLLLIVVLRWLWRGGFRSRRKRRGPTRHRSGREDAGPEGELPFWLAGQWGQRREDEPGARLAALLLEYWRHQGLVRPPGETLREAQARASAAVGGDDGLADAVVAYLYRLRFAEGVPDPAREAEWSRHLRLKLARSIPG